MLEISSVIPTVLSILCSIILIFVWFLNPKWRSLHNFISIHQIVFGTLQLCGNYLSPDLWERGIFYSMLLPASMCWSLCASILAYIRLVFLVTGKISYGKRKAAAFSYGTLFTLQVVEKFIIPNVFELSEDNMDPALTGIYFLVLLNFLIVMKVMSSVVPCCKKRLSRTGGTRTLSLVGIAIVSDMITSITMLMPFLLIFDFLFDYRLIPHTIIVLFNKSSIDYFKKQRERRKQRAIQEIKL